MKKVLLTQKIDAVQKKLVLLASGNRKSSIWHPEWHFDAYSIIGRLQTPSATNQPPCRDPSICPSASNISAVQLIPIPRVSFYLWLPVGKCDCDKSPVRKLYN